jgi:hypothetical protein
MTAEFKKTASMLALLAAAGVMVGGVAPTAARAADLGGDCCADLEERVASLEATAVKKGNKKVSLTITGRVSGTVMAWRDSGIVNTAAVANPATATSGNGPFDQNSDVYFGDVSGSGPRIVIKGDATVSSDLVAGYSIKLNDKFGEGVKNTQTTHQDGPTVKAAETYVYLTSKVLGTVQLGNTTGAAYDAYTLNVNPATMGGESAGRTKGDFFLRQASGLTAVTKYSALLNSFEPVAENRLQYISPVMGDWLKVEADIGGDDVYGLAAILDGKINDRITVKAGIGYQSAGRLDGDRATGTHKQANAADTAKRLVATAGVSDPVTGLFLQGNYAVAYNQGDVANHLNDITFWKVDAGWSKNVTALGNTTLWAGYVENKNVLEDGSKANVLQVGIDQAFEDAGSNVYLTYEATSVEGIAAPKSGKAFDSQTLSTLTGGMTVKF